MIDFSIGLISLIILLCAIMVIFADHPINSLLFLIGCFVNSSLLLFFFGFEFFALIFVAVYVGAIAIFFLFILMTMNIPSYFPTRSFLHEFEVSFFLLVSFYFLYNNLLETVGFLATTRFLGVKESTFIFHYLDSLHLIGFIFYTQFYIYVILSGVLLLYAMVISVILLDESKKPLIIVGTAKIT